MTLDVMDFISRHMISSVQNFRPLGAMEEDFLLCVSRASSKESWRTFLIPKWYLDDFGRQE